MISETENSTVSKLTIRGNFICFVVEDGQRDIKVYGETRIDAGEGLKMVKRRHGRFYEKYKAKYGHGHVWEIIGLKRHTNVLVHIGNTVIDTLGCLLTNYGIMLNPKTKLFYGVDSANAYKEFYNEMEKFNAEEVPFHIIRSNAI